MIGIPNKIYELRTENREENATERIGKEERFKSFHHCGY